MNNNRHAAKQKWAFSNALSETTGTKVLDVNRGIDDSEFNCLGRHPAGRLRCISVPLARERLSRRQNRALLLGSRMGGESSDTDSPGAVAFLRLGWLRFAWPLDILLQHTLANLQLPRGQGEPPRKQRKNDYSFLFPVDYDFSETLIPLLSARGCQTLLFPGNGISQEPRAFAYAGFQVTALDISLYATTCASTYFLTPQHVWHHFRYFRRLSRQDLIHCMEHVPPVTFVTGSLFNPALCPGPFECIITRRVLQCFPLDRQRQAVEQLLARLSPAGVLVDYASRNLQAAWKVRDYLLGRGMPVATEVDPTTFLQSRLNQRLVWIPLDHRGANVE